MSVYTVRPTSFAGATQWAASAGTALTCVNDASDSTYVRKSVDDVPGNQASLGLAAASITAGEFISHVSPFIRYKGTSGKAQMLAVYKQNATKYWLGVYADATIATTAEPGFSSSQVWTVADMANLLLGFYSYDTSSVSRAYVYELGATIYSMAKGTATPSNRTETTSAFPSIPVAVAVDIDTWQLRSGSYFDPWRTFTVQIDVESGGTAHGTGTLVASFEQDFIYTADGTYNETVTLDTSLTNGTYKVYARTIRHRVSENTITSEQYGAWSAAATLTMQAPLPNTPTGAAGPDQTLDRIAVIVTPVATTGYSDPIIYVQRSRDDGSTWEDVRGMQGIAGAFGVQTTLYDYEAEYGAVTKYRHRVAATYTGGAVNYSAWTSGTSGTIDAIGWNLKDPVNPGLNIIGLRVVPEPEDHIDEDLGVFRPLDRRYPVIVSGELTGWDGSLEIHTNTAAQWTALKTLLESQMVLRLESPFDGGKYIRLVGGAKVSKAGTSGSPRRKITVSYVETEAP